jgi:hypothetical protein
VSTSGLIPGATADITIDFASHTRRYVRVYYYTYWTTVDLDTMTEVAYSNMRLTDVTGTVCTFTTTDLETESGTLNKNIDICGYNAGTSYTGDGSGVTLGDLGGGVYATISQTAYTSRTFKWEMHR